MYTKEEIKNRLFDFAKYSLVLDLLKSGDMSVGELKEKAKASIGANAGTREVPKALSNCKLIDCNNISDDNAIVSFNRQKAKELLSEVLNYYSLLPDAVDFKEEPREIEKAKKETSDILPDLKNLWKEIKTALFETSIPRESEVCIHDNLGNELCKEQIRVYPYFPNELEPVGEKNRKPIFPTADNPLPILNEDNLNQNNISSGRGIFKRAVDIKRQVESDSGISDEKKEEAYSILRKELVKEILVNTNLSNEAKLAQYSVITQMPPDIYHLLFSAVANGIDAESIISFLEEPVSAFNYEAVKKYVSIASNKNAVSVRMQLARDLVDGKWAITGADGKLYTVISADLLISLKNLITKAALGETIEVTDVENME